MNCETAEQLVSRAMDGEVDAAERAALDHHLSACAACRARAALWAEAGRMLREESVAAPPAEVMWNDVRRAIRQGAPALRDEPGLLWRLRWAGASIAAVVVLLAGLVALRPHGAMASAPAVEWAETGLPGANTMVMENEETGAIVIWVMTAEGGPNGAAGT